MIKEMIGARLRYAREKAGLSRDHVIALPEIEISRSTLQQWESGATEASIGTIAKLASLYKVSPQYLIFGEEDSNQELSASQEQEIKMIYDAVTGNRSDDYVYVPAYDIDVSAGHGMFSDGAIEPKKYLAFHKDWIKKKGLNPKLLAVLFNEGDSMAPTIPNQSAMVINMLQSKAVDGQVYVIRIDDRLYVKRIQWIPAGGLRLISDNKQYDSFDITKEDMQASDVEVCGQVIHTSYDLPS